MLAFKYVLVSIRSEKKIVKFSRLKIESKYYREVKYIFFYQINYLFVIYKLNLCSYLSQSAMSQEILQNISCRLSVEYFRKTK